MVMVLVPIHSDSTLSRQKNKSHNGWSSASVSYFHRKRHGKPGSHGETVRIGPSLIMRKQQVGPEDYRPPAVSETGFPRHFSLQTPYRVALVDGMFLVGVTEVQLCR